MHAARKTARVRCVPAYVNHAHYFGSTVGRFANRISKGIFALSNQTYQLAINNGPNHLHGGIKGFDKVIWDCAIENNKLILSYVSPHMEENYPGELSCRVTYEVTAKNDVCISYHATTTALTPVNLTNHSYFNLGGHDSGTIEDHEIMINADFYTPVDETSIPTGEILPVASSNFDLRKPTSIGRILNSTPSGMDHNFCINGKLNVERKVASVYHQRSGRLMEVYSTQPGVQFYTANFLPIDDSLIGKHGVHYKKQSAFCLETQNYPDAVNHANFPSALLDVNEEYNHTAKFRFIVR
ncbi:galactose mutarotase-like isoform X2 [Uloborus diversus]|uniref:galactose mutarotase-like isoform X2 n=1 Tax=Uloborus diversus TaxID=327109 RepID=UPI002409690C|nr:galactose mutarotase-like isoform X2 [Uloborus diversus]